MKEEELNDIMDMVKNLKNQLKHQQQQQKQVNYDDSEDEEIIFNKMDPETQKNMLEFMKYKAEEDEEVDNDDDFGEWEQVSKIKTKANEYKDKAKNLYNKFKGWVQNNDDDSDEYEEIDLREYDL